MARERVRGEYMSLPVPLQALWREVYAAVLIVQARPLAHDAAEEEAWEAVRRARAESAGEDEGREPKSVRPAFDAGGGP